MEFEWDEEKEIKNFKKYGIHFDTAVQIFKDHHRIERRDDDDSDEEERWQTIGWFKNVLFVIYTERDDITRIISARPAEPFERRIYGNSKILPGGWERVNP